jgi:membrane protein DedA with SNARE-associated domain
MSFEFISLENIQEIAHSYGYWAIFLGILLENLGIPLPGETVTLVGGFLAGSDELNYWLVLGDAVSGAVLGGICGYWLGRAGGWPFLLNVGKIFRISEARLLSIKEQFSQNAGKTVFFGRFLALLRVFAAPLAGIVEMPFGQFLIYNIAGAAAWGSIMITLAFFAGKVISLEQLVAWASKFAFLAVLIVVMVIVLAVWLESRQVKQEAGE